MSAARALAAELDRLCADLRETTAALAAGENRDLAGIDTSAADLCQRILALPRDQTISFADGLTALRVELDTLGAALMAECDRPETGSAG